MKNSISTILAVTVLLWLSVAHAELSVIHFGTASSKITGKNKIIAALNANWLKENPDVIVILEGHCDERGSEEYNIKLGDRRARAVGAELIENGVDAANQVIIVSYGESKPIDKRHTPSAWRKNRRVEFVVK